MPIRILLLLALVAWPVMAQPDWPGEGERYQSFSADLDHDGRAEQVGLVAYQVTPEEYFGQLTVWSADGKVLWRSPRVRDGSDPLAFGAWNYGVCEIQAVGDLEGDGNVELISPAPVSDVRPVTFRLFRWKAGAFKPVFARTLQEEPAGSGHYRWIRSDDLRDRSRWVGKFDSVRKGTCTVTIWVHEQGEIQTGTAVLVPDQQGFHILRWTRRPQ